MTLTQLRYVLAVADTHSMNEAARTLFIAQPSLSQAVKELAEKMGAPEDLIEYMGPRYTAPGNNPDT